MTEEEGPGMTEEEGLGMTDLGAGAFTRKLSFMIAYSICNLGFTALL